MVQPFEIAHDPAGSELVSAVSRICDEALAFLKSADALTERLDQLVGAPHGLIKIAFRSDGLTATGASKLLLSAEASDGALRLLAALRAGNANLRVIEEVLGHLISPVGCDDSTVGGPAGAVATSVGGDPTQGEAA